MASDSCLIHSFISMPTRLAHDIGLNFRPSFLQDKQLYCALIGAPIALSILAALYPAWNQHIHPSAALIFLMTVWQPLTEELLFRGIIQGQLKSSVSYARNAMGGITVANGFTSLLFMLAHLIHHPPEWAVAVIIPSLVFGYFRDRHEQIYPSILLHGAYNGCYLLMA